MDAATFDGSTAGAAVAEPPDPPLTDDEHRRRHAAWLSFVGHSPDSDPNAEQHRDETAVLSMLDKRIAGRERAFVVDQVRNVFSLRRGLSEKQLEWLRSIYRRLS